MRPGPAHWKLSGAAPSFVSTTRMRPSPTIRRVLGGGLLAAAVVATACATRNALNPPAGTHIAIGTWGGEGAGVIATDSLTHIHIGCTFGDVIGRVVLDVDGRFNVSGSYMLHAFPIAVGPSFPAQFSGRVDGSTLTLIVAVNDTVARKLVALGPVSVRFDRQPKLGPCPICAVPRRGN